MKQSPSTTSAISGALVQARLSATALPDFPGDLPPDSASAYAVQHASIAAWPDRLAGFKVGGIAPAFRDAYGANWLAGAVFESHVKTIADGAHAEAPVFKDGFAAFEAEWILVLDDMDWDNMPEVTADYAKSCVTGVHIGMEIASSPMPMINDLGPGAIISDFGNNSWVYMGAACDLDVLDRFDQVEVELKIDGEVIGRNAAKAGTGGPLDALTFLLGHLREHRDTLDLPSRLIVSTGAITGVHDAHIGQRTDVTFGDEGSYSLTLTRKAPHQDHA